MQKRLLFAAIFLACTAALLAWIVSSRQPAALLRPQMATAASSDSSGFERALGPRPFTFPDDHGPHPDFQTEWWYYTGNLDAPSGEHFGYQLTFFRRALMPSQSAPERSSAWATRQVYLAHFALADISQGNHQAFERMERGAAGLAGAQVTPFQVWLDDWQVQETTAGTYRLQARQAGLELDLQLTDLKGPVLQGEQGYSRKGPQPGQASYYYSQSRLDTQGTVQVNGTAYPVSGDSWMDHEFSTSALDTGQVGWDWFALQLSDGSELMVFQIRRADGSIDPFSSGTLVAPDGSSRSLSQADFNVGVEKTWQSPTSGGVYPARWTVTIPSEQLTLQVEPYLANQELNLSYTYWEGAVSIRGQRAGEAITGRGYVELTGYAGSMGGQF